MTFYVEGRSKHELMPLERLFDKRLIEKAHKTDATHTINPKELRLADKNNHRQNNASRLYQEVGELSQEKPVVIAEQVMSSPVITFKLGIAIYQASSLFHSHKFRHVPVMSLENKLIGIISDRDIMRALAEGGTNNNIESVMKKEVLTASIKTDIRYIARLFVENRIGSIPVMSDRELVGIITRSDILKAVFRHYELELWV